MSWTRWLNALASALSPKSGARRTRKQASNPRRSRRMAVEQLESRLVPSAVVWTDKPDYSPGSTAIMAGSGFQVGETVQLQVLRTDGVPDYAEGNVPWQVKDGDTSFIDPYKDSDGIWHYPDLDGQVDGNFQTTWYVEPQYAGASLELTATGLTSGEVVQATFT